MPDQTRPDPDALLAALQKGDVQQKRGRLKIFLGMAPGVGKTYSMLEAARREYAAGRDVVIGYVETHGRAETDALTAGMPIIPRAEFDYRGMKLPEMDLDAVLARKPQLVLVDELAHTNAPGARHPKRYIDVTELLDAGINVYTTLNVQHVESRAETVREITGATIHETVPDSMLDQAEIELVDLPPDDLIKRLSEGKVYVPERAQAAAQHFFRTGNLTALRELALRLAAEHVGHNVRDYLVTRQIAGPWKTAARLLVGISPSPLSAGMARWTRRLADNLQASWLAVYVDRGVPLTEAEENLLEQNLAVARELGAEVITTSEEDVVRALLRVARQHNVTQIVVGKPVGLSVLDLFRGGSILNRLIRDSGNIDILCVRAEPGKAAKTAPRFRRLPRSSNQQYAAALVVVALITVLNFPLRTWTGYYAVSLVYLLGLVGLALFVGRGPILLAATASAFLWDFFFLPPLYTFYIQNVQDGMMFGMFFVVALVLGQLTTRLRAQQAGEREREEQATALYLLTRELAEGKDFAEVLGVVIRQLGAVFKADVAVLLSDASAPGELVPYPFGTLAISEKEASVADWAFRNGKPAGYGTDTLVSAESTFLPLVTPSGCFGVIGLRMKERRKLSLAERNLLDSFLRQIALVMDRQRLREAEVEAHVLAESERLSKALLNSISHELRTPLAAITTAASALADLQNKRTDQGATTPPLGAPASLPARVTSEMQSKLISEVAAGSARLNRLVGNLLDMTRLESGRVKPRLDWCDVTDLVNDALRKAESELARHKTHVSFSPNLPLVKLDGTLIEQALVNLLVNAAAYTPAGTEVEIKASASGNDLLIVVADHGPGLATETLPHVFEKFYRAPKSPAGGIGLGLSIVKGFVEAHGGRVSVQNRAEGGAEFSICLPIGERAELGKVHEPEPRT